MTFDPLEFSSSRTKRFIGDSGQQASHAQTKHVASPTNDRSTIAIPSHPPSFYTPSPEPVRDNLAHGADNAHAFLDKVRAEYHNDDSESMAGSLKRPIADTSTTIPPTYMARGDDDPLIELLKLLKQPAERKREKDLGALRATINRLECGVPPIDYFTNGVKDSYEKYQRSQMSLMAITDGFSVHGAEIKLAERLDCFDEQQWQVEASTRQSHGLYCCAFCKDRRNLEWQASQDYHRRNAWRPSRAVALLGFASCWSTAAAHKIMSKSITGNATDLVVASMLNIDTVQGTLRSFYRLGTTMLPPTFLFLGLSASTWVLLRKKKASDRQTTAIPKHNFWWLMAFTASVTCWVLFATSDGPDNGKYVALTAWAACFSIYQSLNRRAFSHHNVYLFTSLLGGIVAASIIAGATVASGQGDRSKAMVEQALIVFPAVLTVWSWLTANVQRSVENGQRINDTDLPDPEHGAIELEDR